MVFRTKNNSIIQTLGGINTLGIAPERKKKKELMRTKKNIQMLV